MTDTPVINQKRKVLCIEDERFIGELYTRALTKSNYEITVVASGKEGLERAKSNTYDIILLDLMVPDLLGVDVLSDLRQSMPNLRAKVIVTTNLEQGKPAREKAEQQADGYIIKAEVTPRQLVEYLDTLKI